MRRKLLWVALIVLILVVLARAAQQKQQPQVPAEPTPGQEVPITPEPTPTPQPPAPELPKPPKPGAAVDANIRVDAAKPLRDIPDALYGSQIIWWSDSAGFATNASTQAEYRAGLTKFMSYLPSVRNIAPTVIRYPGGLEANEYRWTDGIGPFADRPAINWSNRNRGVKVALGTDEFLRFTEALGAEAMITLNATDVGVPSFGHVGSQQEAMAWLAYTNGRTDDATSIGTDKNGRDWQSVGDWAKRRESNCRWLNANTDLPERDCTKPYHVKYWELGNEVSYSLVWPIPPVSQSPNRYGEIVGRYAPALKGIDATIQIGAVGNDNPIYGHAAWEGWFEGVAKTAASQPNCANGSCYDFWIKHEYYPAGGSPTIKALLLNRAGARLTWQQNILKAGDYTVTFNLYGKRSLLQDPRWSLEVDGKAVAQGQTKSTAEVASSTSTNAIALSAGTHTSALVAGDNVSGSRPLEVDFTAVVAASDGRWSRTVNLRTAPEVHALILAAAPAKAAYLPEPKSAIAGKPIFVTEFNAHYEFRTHKRSQEQVYLQDALVVAGAYAEFARSGAVGGANVWLLFDDFNEFGEIEGVAAEEKREDAASHGKATSSSGSLGRRDPRLRPTGLVHALYGRALRGKLLTVNVEGPSVDVSSQSGLVYGLGSSRDSKVSWLDAVASRPPDGRIAIIVSNRDPLSDHTARITLSGASISGTAAVEQLTGSELMSSNEPEDCASGGCVAIKKGSMDIGDDAITYTFPKHSVTSLVVPVR